jgi:alanine dehydrogenase
MWIQVGAHCLEKEQGGAGALLGGAGRSAGKVVIIGGGVSGIARCAWPSASSARVTDHPDTLAAAP